MSPTARTAEVITYEWAFALGAGFDVIPVIAAPTELHPRLAALDPLDFTLSPRWEDLCVRVWERADLLSYEAIPVPAGIPAAVGDTLAALHAHTAAERLAAVQALAGIDHPAARFALVAAATHPIFADVRRAVAESLGRIGSADGLPALLAALADPDDSVSRAAANSLVGFGDDAVPGLVEIMRSDARIGRRTAVWVLSRIGSPAVVPALIEALTMPGWFAPRTAAVTLGTLGDASAVPALIETLASDDDALVRLAADALAAIGTPDALAALVSRGQAYENKKDEPQRTQRAQRKTKGKREKSKSKKKS